MKNILIEFFIVYFYDFVFFNGEYKTKDLLISLDFPRLPNSS